MKILNYIVLLGLMLFATPAKSQTISITRTDVDSSRVGFVTASYMFMLDIRIENISKCNGVAFEVNFNQIDYVKYSGWRKGDFPENTVIFNLNPNDGLGRIIVGTSTGTPLQDDGIDEPSVIKLEFVVLQTAPHGEELILDFVQPVATIVDNEEDKIIPLGHSRNTFKINGFIHVWPGDTDNNGIVNHLDIAPINLYMGKGSRTKNWRSFKRENASTIWKPQRVLAWDFPEVTFADCDGNGEITARDILVVDYNIDRDTNTTFPGKIISIDEVFDYPEPDVLSDETTLAIPIKITPVSNFLSAAGELSFIHFNNDIEVLGIENGNIFNKNPYLYYNVNNEDKKVSFAVGTYNKIKPTEMNGVLANLIIRLPQHNNSSLSYPSPYIERLEGITDLGNFLPLDATTSIYENTLHIDNSVVLLQEKDYIYLKCPESVNNYKINIYNMLGQSIFQTVTENNEINISLSLFQSGYYMIQLNNGFDIYSKSFVVTE